MAIAERRLAAEFNRAGSRRSSTTGPTSSPPTATSRRGSPRRRRAWPATCGSASSSCSTTTTTSSSTARRRWPGRRTSPSGSMPTAGTRQRVEDGNDLDAIEAAIEAAHRRRPAEPHRGPDPHRLRQPEQARQPEGARLAARARRGPPHQGGLRLGSGSQLLRPRRGARDCSATAIPAGERARRRLGGALRRRTATPIRRPAAEFRRRIDGTGLPDGWDADLKTYETGTEVATRNASQDAIQALAPRLPELFGGAADLSESNLTDVKGEPNFSADEPGRNLRFGVREHGMGGIANGIALPRRVHPLLRHVPDVQRLHARRRSGWRRCPGSTSSTSGPTIRSGSARTARPTSRSSTTPPCARSRTCGSSGRATPTRRPRPGRSPSSARDGPVALALTRQKLPTLAGTDRAGARGRRPRRLRPARGVGRARRS